MSKEVIQSLFDRSVNHILDQGKASVYRMGGVARCCYRSPDNLKCAAGIFIKDYDLRMEGKSWPWVCRNFPERIEPDAAHWLGFVDQLQICHDQAAVDKDILSPPEFLHRYAVEILKVVPLYEGLRVPERLRLRFLGVFA